VLEHASHQAQQLQGSEKVCLLCNLLLKTMSRGSVLCHTCHAPAAALLLSSAAWQAENAALFRDAMLHGKELRIDSRQAWRRSRLQVTSGAPASVRYFLQCCCTSSD
jgi:hypothetical protein